MSKPLTKQELVAALKTQTDDIVEALTKRSEAVENKLDAHEVATLAAFKRIEGKLDAALLLEFSVTNLQKRVTRLEKRLGVRP
jgi:hypothetical protein